MARSRNIKPGTMENEDLASLSALHRLLFIYLWMLADREGRLEDRPLRIKAKTLPYDITADVDAMLTDLHDSGFITRYAVGGGKYIQIDTFDKHQKPHANEVKSAIPSMEEILSPKVEALTPKDKSTCDHGNKDYEPDDEALGSCISDSLIPDSLIACEKQEAYASVDSGEKSPTADLLDDSGGNGLTGDQNEKGIPACPVQQIVAIYHECMPLNPRVRIVDDARRKTIQARWKQASLLDGVGPFGYSTGADGLKAWRKFFEVCAQSEFLTGRATPRQGKRPFIADIDFLTSPKGFKKSLENRYHEDDEE